MATLVIQLPSGTEETFELTDDTVTVGRLPDNTIQIDDASVSSNHAELTVSGSDYHLKDLGSTNGTRINGELIEEADLTPGVAVRFGKIDAVYSPPLDGETQPMPKGEELAATPAAQSSRPSDFANASPFQSKGKEKNTAGQGIMGFAIFSMIVFLGAVATILALSPEQ